MWDAIRHHGTIITGHDIAGKVLRISYDTVHVIPKNGCCKKSRSWFRQSSPWEYPLRKSGDNEIGLSIAEIRYHSQELQRRSRARFATAGPSTTSIRKQPGQAELESSYSCHFRSHVKEGGIEVIQILLQEMSSLNMCLHCQIRIDKSGHSMWITYRHIHLAAWMVECVFVESVSWNLGPCRASVGVERPLFLWAVCFTWEPAAHSDDGYWRICKWRAMHRSVWFGLGLMACMDIGIFVH